MTEEQAALLLAGMNEVIRAGEETRRLRAEMIKTFADLGWTQDRIARLTEVSQPAVSKQVARYKRGELPPPLELSLQQYDTPWLEGRLWGLAEALSESLADTAHCTRHVHALARGRKRFTPRHVDALRRLVEEDLRAHRSDLPGAYRTAYDEISRGLDVPSKAAADMVGAGSSAAVVTASMRRALAQQIQRVRLRDDC
ncbi:helix-turn-helix domain-containing protein [Streptomyces aureocirculatus]|uniref:helix-turn-helix domain-containing protein n=1 Tax=Streptomyces aureocirculatus TaxID=67275 RepID=UPI000AF7A390|nr:helix-turn-helix domain-containing protein [Streptomyces aureocirculatus]